MDVFNVIIQELVGFSI